MKNQTWGGSDMRKAKTRGIALILFAVMLFSAAAGIVPARGAGYED